MRTKTMPRSGKPLLMRLDHATYLILEQQARLRGLSVENLVKKIIGITVKRFEQKLMTTINVSSEEVAE